MSVTTIKSALIDILTEANTGLKHVEPHYPRPTDEVQEEDYPRAVLFRKRGQERRTAAGGVAPSIGYKKALWSITIHVMGLYLEPLDAPWDELLENIYEALRSSTTRDGALKGKANTSKTKVITCEDFDEESVQPQAGPYLAAFNTFITVIVEEWIQG